MKFRLIEFAIAIFIITILVSCANRKSPTGGEKDVKGPQIVDSKPNQKALNFKGEELYFEFNEHIKEDKLLEKIVISPALDSTFTYKIIKKKLYLTFNKKLKYSTTYTINFAEGIKDITEGNTLSNPKFTFSTGNFLDSLKISGKVVGLEDNKGLKDILVGLYLAKDTLTPFNSKPIYISNSNEKGEFILENIRQEEYLIYAIQDKNRDLKYSNQGELIGFLDDTLNVKININNIKIPLQKFDLRNLRVLLKSNKEKDLYNVEFNKGLKDIFLSYPKDTTEKVLYTFNKENNKVSIYNNDKKADSIPLHIISIDSFDIKLDTTLKIVFPKEEEETRKGTKKKEEKNRSFTPSILPLDKTILSADEVEVISEFPITKIFIDRIYFFKDSVTTYKLEEKDFVWNKNRTNFKISKKIPFSDTIYFRLDSGAFLNAKKDTSEIEETMLFKKRPEKYSTIGGTVALKYKNFIVQLIKKENNKIYSINNSTNFRFDYLEPGTYMLRVLVDENKNGKWDRGDLKKRIEPERIIYYEINDNKGNPTSEISLKANWELLDNTIGE